MAIEKITGKTKNGQKVPSLEVVEVVLVQCNLIDNQHQQKSEVSYTFTPNKSYAYLLSDNVVLLKAYNTESDEIIIKFMDHNLKFLNNE